MLTGNDLLKAVQNLPSMETEMTKTFNLSQEQIAFIVDAIDMFEGYGDYVSSDGKYKLAEDEVDATISMFSEELK